MKTQTPYRRRYRKSAVRAASLLEKDIRRIGESRGFAASKVLVHWDEVIGPEIAALARPVDISYGRGGLGATLTLLVKGADAPVVEMQKEQIRARVNACYGYEAIRRIRLTQTSATGFGEEATPYKSPERQPPSPDITRRAGEAAADVQDPELRRALEALGTNVLAQTPLRRKPS
ncbi:DUF721 domain-containing protein [Palleronia caenipelagi]|uniref:DUF721 domain-containing protein n=1 Tax=Palleronia caenipelagi TaxID=2489174 RepID=A0A547Q891_9RHOB|nr:DciA family protein [Palleronia caenipelagi]TRD22596.1 DUF721 domain-containing protein [Palleronia caenipelagi]